MKKFLLLAAISVFVNPMASFATSEGVVCAAVLPCNSDGTVWEAYRNGPCGEVYEKNCSQSFYNKSLASCHAQSLKSSQSLQKQIKDLKKQIKSLKRSGRR